MSIFISLNKFIIKVSVFSYHQRVNLYLCVSLGWCAWRTQGFILVRAEHAYVQFAAARVTGTSFAVGVRNRRERERILKGPNMARGRVNSLLKNVQIN